MDGHIPSNFVLKPNAPNKLVQANYSRSAAMISSSHPDANHIILNQELKKKTGTHQERNLFFLRTLILFSGTATLPLHLIFKELLFTNKLLLPLQSNSFLIGNLNPTNMKAKCNKAMHEIVVRVCQDTGTE